MRSLLTSCGHLQVKASTYQHTLKGCDTDEYMKSETAHRLFPVEVSASNIKGNLQHVMNKDFM